MERKSFTEIAAVINYSGTTEMINSTAVETDRSTHLPVALERTPSFAQ